MTRAEAKQAYYDRTPVEIYVTSVGWTRMLYIDQLIYSRPEVGYADRDIPSDMYVRVLDKTGRAVSVCNLDKVRIVEFNGG